MKRFRRWCGGGVVGLAIVLLVTFFFSPFTPGGFVEGGKVEDGRYFVVSKGHRYTEVSETQWRIAQYVECTFPWLPVMLIWLGVGLRVAPATGAEPAPRPLASNAALGLSIAFGVVAGTGALAVARCFSTGVPWAIGIGVWLALWVGIFTRCGTPARHAHN